ncbi:MAG TPA: BLUF domain-containing protein [Allosphingosinicella sp.]|nr:BLUF domain-containing protein [Allosphingosinicella sp.]
MTQDLYRLVYYSRNCVAGHAEAHEGAVRAILAASRANNPRAGVTGALLFNAGCFGQVLEGARRAVESTFERIQRDPRHAEVSLLAFEPAAARAFPNWAMAWLGSEARGAARFGDIAQGSGFDPSRMSADALFETLQRLALEEEKSAAA